MFRLMLKVLGKPATLCLFVVLGAAIGGFAKNDRKIPLNRDRGTVNLSTLKMKINSPVNHNPTAQIFLADSTHIHTVKKGETLYAISNEYGVSVSNIKRWNGLSGNAIQVGDKLKIYPQKESQKSFSLGTKISSGKGHYTVKPGDTLFRIAQMYQMSIKELKALNNLASNTIQAGQKLIVKSEESIGNKNTPAVYGRFIHYTVTSTVPRDSLLNRFGMGKGEFMALNPSFNDTTMRAGDNVKLFIPPTKLRQNPYRVEKDLKNLGMMPASKYPPHTFGTTTNGELYNPEALTAGSPNLRIGTVIFVKNKQNERGVFVRINDRSNGKGLTLSNAAWTALQLTENDNKVMVFRPHEQ